MEYLVVDKRSIAAAAYSLEGRPVLVVTAKPTSSVLSVVRVSRSLSSHLACVLPRISAAVIPKAPKSSVREGVEVLSR